MNMTSYVCDFQIIHSIFMLVSLTVTIKQYCSFLNFPFSGASTVAQWVKLALATPPSNFGVWLDSQLLHFQSGTKLMFLAVHDHRITDSFRIPGL